MGAEFKLPELGGNIETIRVVRVMVASGGSVAVDQPVLELETDKATIEVPSSLAGTVAAVYVQPGDEIKQGSLIFSLADGGSSGGEGKPAAPVHEDTRPPVETPAAAPGGSVQADDAVVSSESPRIPADATPAAPDASPVPTLPGDPTGHKAPAAPSVRRFAREIGIALESVAGSGPHGRISKEDVKRHARHLNASRPVSGAAALPPLPDFTRWGTVERRKMTVIRTRTAEHLALSWSQVPHVTIHEKADITELDRLRRQYAGLAEQEGGKLTMAVMVCKIVAQALRKFPVFNASVDMATREILFKSYVHLGIAVNTSRGLMVPVVRDADTKNMVTLAVEIHSLAAKCRDGKIALEELEGSTFTVTNLGRVGGLAFTPIVNYPEVAILGLGRAHSQPAAVNGAIAERTLLPLSLSFDHRVIDGADGAVFMGWIKEAIEQPLLLALNG